ncbi:hypothetical protein RSAG8_03734, partial [Rhizoctonia solani AG-8 WAC10335]
MDSSSLSIARPDSLSLTPRYSVYTPSRLSYASSNSLTCSINALLDGSTDDESFRRRLVQQTLNAERRYIAGLEVMHDYARELVQLNILDTDTVHHLFPGLSQLLDFGRRFLVEVEVNAQRAWEDQRWGLLFIENEDEFAVYESYCSNYADASNLMLTQEENLMVCIDLPCWVFLFSFVPPLSSAPRHLFARCYSFASDGKCLLLFALLELGGLTLCREVLALVNLVHPLTHMRAVGVLSPNDLAVHLQYT